MFNTSTGLMEASSNTATGLSDFELDSLTVNGVDFTQITDTGSGQIITDDERDQLEANTQDLNQIFVKTTPLSYNSTSDILTINSTVLLEDEQNVKQNLRCGDISSLTISSGNIDVNDIDANNLDCLDIVCSSVTSNSINLNNAITANANNISANTSNIATNTSNISTNTSNISTNTSNIATNTQNISTNTQNISTNTSNISSLDTLAVQTALNVANHDDRIHDLEDYTAYFEYSPNLNIFRIMENLDLAPSGGTINGPAYNLTCGDISCNAISLNSSDLSTTLTNLRTDVDNNKKHQYIQAMTTQAIPIFAVTSSGGTYTTPSSYIDLSSSSVPFLKSQIFKIEIQNTSSSQQSFYFQTNIGQRNVLQIHFIKRNIGTLLWIDSSQDLAYHSGGPKVGQIEIIAPGSSNFVAYATIQYLEV
jgi:hypothetical protein